MGHEAVDGATGLWALQPLVQGATERVHHLNLQGDKRKEGNVRAVLGGSSDRMTPIWVATNDGMDGRRDSGGSTTTKTALRNNKKKKRTTAKQQKYYINTKGHADQCRQPVEFFWANHIRSYIDT